MMKISFALSALVFVFSCGSPQPEKEMSEPKKETKNPREEKDLLKEYMNYTTSLDLKSAQSVSLAAEKYQELFSGSDSGLCDSAFVVFDQLYRNVGIQLNERLMNDKFYVDFPCISYDSLGVKEVPFDKRYVSFRKSIEKNGFRIDCPEGMVEIAENRSFIIPRFYNLVSPVMKEFLEGYRKEQDEELSADAGISISPEDYVDRLVWWDKFNNAHPDFILSQKAKSYQIYLFHFFLTGMDNTPAINYHVDENGVESMELDEYFVKAYAYLDKKHHSSPINTLVQPYKMTVLKKDHAKRERLIKTYTKRGLMIDFSKDFDLEL